MTAIIAMLYTLIAGIVSVAIGTYLLGSHRQAIMPAASETNGVKKPWADAPLALIPTPTFLTNKVNKHNPPATGDLALQRTNISSVDRAGFI